MMLKKDYVFEKNGFCPICEKQVVFRAEKAWFRDALCCSSCGSIPRERALMHVLNTFYPTYKDLDIHETSPCQRGTSLKLRSDCPGYTASHYYPYVPLGESHPGQGFRCENLEKLTFPDETFDIVISQDVMEHIFNPEKAFKEISRVLRPGGAHIFTVPLLNKENRSERRAILGHDGEVIHYYEPDYHGNPIDKEGSLVTMYWGYDIAEFILQESGMPSTIVMIDNMELGIRAEYIDVIVSRKPVSKTF